MSMKPPQKRFKVTLVIEAWEWQDVLHEAESVIDHIREHGPVCSSVMGGGSMSHVVRVEEDKETTREQWVLDLDTYLAECKAERETTAVEDFDAGTGTLVDAQSYRCRRDGDGGFVMEPCDGSADPNKWDDAGTLREMPPGKWQSLLVFKSGQSTRWVYGQRVFDSADAVKAAVEAKDLPTYDPGLSGWFGIWAVRQGATDLTDNTQAVFLGPDESDPTHTLFLQRTM